MPSLNSTFALSHQILILDAHLQKPLDCSSRNSITREFIKDFLDTLGLERLGALKVYAAVDQRAPGWSFI